MEYREFAGKLSYRSLDVLTICQPGPCLQNKAFPADLHLCACMSCFWAVATGKRFNIIWCSALICFQVSVCFRTLMCSAGALNSDMAIAARGMRSCCLQSASGAERQARLSRRASSAKKISCLYPAGTHMSTCLLSVQVCCAGLQCYSRSAC